MKNLENARVNVIKKVLKVVGIVVVSGLVVVAGFEIFTSIYFNPHDVRLTNVTDTSFTVSWVTNYPKRGVVYYKEKDNILPGVLSWIGTGKAFDDRDVANAEKKCVDEFNKKAEVSEDFVVDTSNYNCESVKVSRLGSYYTHHVTVTNLEPGKEYYFRVGDGFVSWKRDMNQTYTFYSLEKEVKAPSPIFGKITNEEGQYVNDSIVYVKFINGYTKKESIYYSSVTADNGSWYLDGNNIRTIDGELMLVEGGQDTIQVHAQYKNFILTDAYEWVYGDSNIAYPDIVVSDTAEKDLSMNRGVVVDALAALDAGGGGGSTNTVDAGIDTPAKIPIRATPTAPAASATPTAATTRPATTPTAATTSTPAATTPTTTTPTATTPIEQKPQNPSPQAETSKTGFNVSSNITKEMQNTLIALVDSGKTSEARKYAEVIGLGNSARILANQEDVPAITVDILEKLGLAGDSSMSAGYRQSIIVGNMNAIAGYKDKESNLKTSDTCIESSCEGGYEQVYIVPGSPVKVGNPPVSSSVINGGGNAESGAFENGSLVGSVGSNNMGYTIELTFPVENGVLKIPNALTTWFPGSNIQVSNCTEKECKVVLDAVKFNVDTLLGYAIKKNDVSLADPIMKLFNQTTLGLFKDKGIVKLKTSEGKEIQIIDSNLTVTGLDVLPTTDKITVTDELRKIFPQIGNDKTINVQTLRTLIEARNTIIEKYDNLINKKESSSDTSSVDSKENTPDVDSRLTLALTKGNTPLAGSIIDPLNQEIAKLFKNGAVVELVTDEGKILTIKDSSLKLESSGLVDGTNKIIVTDELKTIFPQLSNSTEISVSGLKSLIQGRQLSVDTYNSRINEDATKDGCRIPCTGGTTCSGGICMSAMKEVYMVGTSMGKQEEGKEFNAICVEEDGCNCKYSNVTLHVGKYGVCESEEALNSLRDTSDEGIFGKDRDASALMYEKYEDLYLYLYYQISTLEDEIEKAQKAVDDAKEARDKSNHQQDYPEKEHDYRASVQYRDGLVGKKEELEELRTSIDAYKRSQLDKINECLKTKGDDYAFYECAYGKENIVDYGVVKGASDTTTTSDTSSNSLGSGYITYLPEYGFFDLEIEGLIEGQKVEGGEGNPRIFYVEMNGKSGLQFPEDPDNPQAGEDIVLRTNALDITYKKSAEVMTLNVKKGVNLISFSYLPQIQTNEYTKASDIVLWLRSKGVRAENLSYFSAGRWQGVGYVNGEITGNDFSITPGRGYLLYSLDDGQISIPGYRLTSSVPISLSMGWNLVGIHGYSKIYTARSLLNSINKVEGLTANNISWWPTSKGKYEGLQLTDGKEYGFDFAISPNNGYFIRINKFEPKDTSCGSLLWQEGGTHNGVCGDSKTM